MSQLADINQYHKLKSINVHPSQLILDPSNPRINVDFETDRVYTLQEILSETVQSELLRKISMDEYRVLDLVEGIRRSGFLKGMGTIIVERVDATDKFIVLEGNRRTTAIKHLLQDTPDLPKIVQETMESIEVKEFTYVKNDRYSKDEIVDILLGTIHITGPLAWGAMEKAYYIFKAYQREIKRICGENDFIVDKEVIKKVGGIFNSKDVDIIKSLRVYRIFQQLKSEGYKVESKKYSLIELATSNRHLRNEYFGMDASYHFTNVGLDRFSSLCLDLDSPITNPQSFNQFKYIHRNGEEKNVKEIENRSCNIEKVYQKVRDNKEESRVLDELKDILNKLRGLSLFGFANDDEEREIVQSISKVVNNKLMAIIQEDEDDDVEDEWYYPTSAEELFVLESQKKQTIIKEMLWEKPNNTCIKSNVSNYVLQYLEIRTSRRPKELLVERVNYVVEDMINDGLLKEYKAGTNQRIKLLTD